MHAVQGTHADTIVGNTWGIAKAVKLHPIRVLGCNGSGSNSGVIAGMDWVASNHVRPAVANMSLGGGASQSTDDAVARLTNAGVMVAVVAGNDNSSACNCSPARAPSAITVGSTSSTDARSSFSNYGTCLDIFGPGSSINSAGSATATMSGTSMASPHVAGVEALYLTVNPSATPSQVTTALDLCRFMLHLQRALGFRCHLSSLIGREASCADLLPDPNMCQGRPNRRRAVFSSSRELQP